MVLEQKKEKRKLKRFLMNICKNCGKEFIKEGQKKKASYCSPICNSNHWHRKKREELRIKKGKKKEVEPKTNTIIIDNCIYCGSEFLKTRIDRIYCSKYCGLLYNNEKRKGTSVKIKVKEDYIHEIEKFVIEIKEKRFWADMIDIFKLIHYHAIKFPHKVYDDAIFNKEQIFNMMYKDLVDYIHKKPE
jgi:hypothetical protein